MTSSWFFLSTLNYDARSTTHQRIRDSAIRCGYIYKTYTTQLKERISLGNKTFYANKDLFESKLLAKNSKLQMYKTLVRPVVTCACETWVLKENIKTKLRVFERKVLRRIYGPTKRKRWHMVD